MVGLVSSLVGWLVGLWVAGFVGLLVFWLVVFLVD